MKKSQKSNIKSQKLDTDEVKHVANLANLHLTQGEVTKFQEQLSYVLGYFKILNRLDTTNNIKPTFQATALENIFRGDEIGKEGLSQKEALSNTKSKERGFFKIRKIL